MPYFTGWFLDIKISKNVRINTYREGLLEEITAFIISTLSGSVSFYRRA
jgi:hypothetical protein